MDQILLVHILDTDRYLVEYMLDLRLGEPALLALFFPNLLLFAAVPVEVTSSSILSHEVDFVIQRESLNQFDNVLTTVAHLKSFGFVKKSKFLQPSLPIL